MTTKEYITGWFSIPGESRNFCEKYSVGGPISEPPEGTYAETLRFYTNVKQQGSKRRSSSKGNRAAFYTDVKQQGTKRQEIFDQVLILFYIDVNHQTER